MAVVAHLKCGYAVRSRTPYADLTSAARGLDRVLREILKYQQNQIPLPIIQLSAPCPVDFESHALLDGSWFDSRPENLEHLLDAQRISGAAGILPESADDVVDHPLHPLGRRLGCWQVAACRRFIVEERPQSGDRVAQSVNQVRRHTTHRAGPVRERQFLV